MKEAVAGEMMLYRNGSVFSTAKLSMGSGTSGKLVSEVKKQLASIVDKETIAIIDGSPGIGCPVIASLSGADMALIVAEPSISGISDMERIITSAKHFGVKTIVCVNKYDININNTRKIESYCRENEIPFAGKIPYDENAIKAINEGKSIAEVECMAGYAIKAIYDRIIEIMKGNDIL